MRELIGLCLIVLVSMVMSGCIEKSEGEKWNYPVTRKDSVVDNYFGTSVSDPYRWLENDTATEVAEWVNAQNAVSSSYLDSIPFRDPIKDRLTGLWNFEKQSTPFKEGNKIFYYKNDGLQNQSVLYMKDSVDGEPEILLDPNKLSEDGTIALAGLGFSKDGKYLGYSISKGGSDWNEIFVRDVETGLDTKDHIIWVKFSSIEWYGQGFFYSRYDAPGEGKELSLKNEFHKVYYHKLGDDQSNDKLVYENLNEPDRTYSAQITEDEKYLLLYEGAASMGNALYVKSLEKENADFIKLVDGFDYEFGVFDNDGSLLFVRTNFNAPRYKVISIDVNKPEQENWKDVIAETENVLESVSAVGGYISATYMKDAYNIIKVFGYDGKEQFQVDLPTLGASGGLSGKKEDKMAFYSFSSYTYPTVIYKFDLESKESSLIFEPQIDFDLDAYETKQVFYSSKDGTKIPMFLTHKKGLELNGNNPTMLYGYGGFNISLTPGFAITPLILLEQGGIYAVANIRGGGEYGAEWHEAGTKLKKQNVFDDFIAAAEYLIANKYTNSSVLAIRGGSNGGLLVGAVSNQRPDLFKVAFPAVGVMDMLRFHKFTIGWHWTGDYGSSDDSVQFNYIYKYSPIHNIRENVEYPATLVTTADHDDRVVPAHSFKYIATLQEKYKGKNPVMIRVDVMAGHGAGKPTSKTIEEIADMWAFAFKNWGINVVY